MITSWHTPNSSGCILGLTSFMKTYESGPCPIHYNNIMYTSSQLLVILAAVGLTQIMA